MTLSLSKLMASDKPLTDDERKRLLAIAKAGSEALPLLEALVFVFEQSPIASFAPKTTAKMAADIRKQYDALSAALEGVEL